MSLVESLPMPLEDEAFRILAEDATPLVREALERGFGVRPAASEARIARLGVREAGSLFHRPTYAWRVGLWSTEQRMTIGVIVRERDVAALVGEGSRPEALLETALDAVRRVLEAHSLTAWEHGDAEPLSGALAFFGGGVELTTASCWLEADGSLREICLVALPGALDAWRQIQSRVLLAMRPRLLDLAVPQRPPTGIDPEKVEAIPVTVEATLSAGRQPVGRVASLRVGDVLRLSEDWSHLVRLEVGGRTLARGELVVVAGRWGILVHALGEEA
jgi:flagellar motor switch/type III secretory pathway protein FliN